MFMVGGALGAAEALVFPHVSPGFWALVSLAGVLGGLMRSPLTGIVWPKPSYGQGPRGGAPTDITPMTDATTGARPVPSVTLTWP